MVTYELRCSYIPTPGTGGYSTSIVTRPDVSIPLKYVCGKNIRLLETKDFRILHPCDHDVDLRTLAIVGARAIDATAENNERNALITQGSLVGRGIPLSRMLSLTAT